MLLISDPVVSSVRTIESGEKFVDFRAIHNRIVVDETRSQIGSRSAFFCFGRATLAARLLQSLSFLPEELYLFVKEVYRPIHVQRGAFQWALDLHRNLQPDASDDELFTLTSQYVAPVESAPHPRGAAIDLTLMDADGRELDLGTEFNAVPAEVDFRTHLHSSLVEGQARSNRELLSTAMSRAGFVNYPTEWWHWSYGDKYWGSLTGNSSIYGPVEEVDMPNWLQSS